MFFKFSFFLTELLLCQVSTVCPRIVLAHIIWQVTILIGSVLGHIAFYFLLFIKCLILRLSKIRIFILYHVVNFSYLGPLNLACLCLSVTSSISPLFLENFDRGNSTWSRNITGKLEYGTRVVLQLSAISLSLCISLTHSLISLF